MQPGIMLRDLVRSIPHVVMEEGLLTVPKKGKVNGFPRKILEIDGLGTLRFMQLVCQIASRRTPPRPFTDHGTHLVLCRASYSAG